MPAHKRSYGNLNICRAAEDELYSVSAFPNIPVPRIGNTSGIQDFIVNVSTAPLPAGCDYVWGIEIEFIEYTICCASDITQLSDDTSVAIAWHDGSIPSGLVALLNANSAQGTANFLALPGTIDVDGRRLFCVGTGFTGAGVSAWDNTTLHDLVDGQGRGVLVLPRDGSITLNFIIQTPIAVGSQTWFTNSKLYFRYKKVPLSEYVSRALLSSR